MYQALYRKYRPADFEDVISQPHITTTLKNQIISGKTAHAYIFTGSRGTGKTTCARIFAKALNCENPVNGSPCGKCDICRDADNFALSDIIEIDAASNGKVEDARELREAAEYTPERCRYKVYIIDEVHMLSKDAFNALLKLIEEPPPHVKFIMATTEIHKVLATILSRCQRFDFMRIKAEDIAARLKTVAEKENISLSEDAALLIARAADGGMRDALSILDRCIAFSENVTAEVVSEAAGISGRDKILTLAQALSGKKTAEALDITAGLYSGSKDMQRLCEELSEVFRSVMITASVPENPGLAGCLPSEMQAVRELADSTPLPRVMKILEALGACSERMTRSLSKRTDMEMCLIKICSDSGSGSSPSSADAEIARLTSKIAELEKQLSRGIIPVIQTGFEEPRRAAPPGREPVKEIPSAGNKSEFVYIDKWFDIVERLKTDCPALAPVLTGSYGYDYGGKLVINRQDNKLLKVLLRSEDNKAKVLKAAEDIVGVSLATVLAGYRPELDRSTGQEQYEAAAVPEPSPKEKLDAVFKKAEDGGVTVETI